MAGWPIISVKRQTSDTLAKPWGILSRPQMELAAINSHLSEEFVSQSDNHLQTPVTWQRCSDPPLGVEDAVERGPSPVLARQREDGPQVVEGDVTLWEGALQPGFLEGGPLLLQGPGTSQIPLERGHIRSFKWLTSTRRDWNDGWLWPQMRHMFEVHRTHGGQFPPRIQVKVTAPCSFFLPPSCCCCCCWCHISLASPSPLYSWWTELLSCCKSHLTQCSRTQVQCRESMTTVPIIWNH